MLFALALTLSANTVFAATNTTTKVIDHNTTQNQVNGQTSQANNQNLSKNTVKSSELAAGSASTTKKVTSTKTVVKPKVFSKNQINSAASSVKSFVDKNKRLPNYVTISSVKVTMPQFLGLLTDDLLNRNIQLQKVSAPSSTLQTVKSGNLVKSKYLSLAKTVKSTIDSKGVAPGYEKTSLGKIKYESMIYTFSKILVFQKSHKRLPNYVAVTPWKTVKKSEGTSATKKTSTSTSSTLAKYLKATANAQSNSSTIKKLAASITKGKKTSYDKAKAVFNWVRDHLSYSYYYNTKKGALGALKSRSANCVDTSHLVVALARAAGVPARYQHGNCRFSDGTFGHVWAQLYANGKWYYADAISNSNTFGTIKNWNLKTVKLLGTYISLPF